MSVMVRTLLNNKPPNFSRPVLKPMQFSLIEKHPQLLVNYVCALYLVCVELDDSNGVLSVVKFRN